MLSGREGADVFHTWCEAGLGVVVDFDAAGGDRLYLLPGTEFSLAQAGYDMVITKAGAAS